MDREKILATLRTAQLGRQFYLLEETTSTFDALKQHPPVHGLTVAARRQTSGVGRRGKNWESPSGGIYFSTLLLPDLSPADAPFITLLCALSVHRALDKRLPCGIKWPNDVVCGGKKVCGILTLANCADNVLKSVSVGMGINANTLSFPDELEGRATSVRLETGKTVDPNKLLCDILYELELCLQGDRAALLEEYKCHCVTLGAQVTAHFPDKEVKGTCTDITPDGCLVLQTKDGQTLTVGSGEVSVRGIYGYV